MRRIDKMITSVNSTSLQTNCGGVLSSTGSGGKKANINNLHGSQLRDVTVIMPYGVSSRPKKGVKVQTLVNDDDDVAMVGCYDSNRPDVEAGETMIYSNVGSIIYLDKNGNIIIKSKKNVSISAKSVSISADSVSINSNVSINGSLTVNGQSVHLL